MRPSCAIVLLLAFGGSISISYGQPDKVLYELQERCGKRAEETFKKDWGANVVNTAKGQITANYENHYSPGLNKCFYLEISTTYELVSNKLTRILRLFDLNENKEYGTFIEGLPSLCIVRDRSCSSEAEWRALVKPYMDD